MTSTGVVRELRCGRVASTLELGPLSSDDVAAMLADTAMPAGLVESITRRGQGNPFFVEELAAAALEGDAGVPPAVRDALLHRIDQLGDNGRAVARVAAPAGGDVPYGLFAAVLAMPGARLRAALRQAVDHGVLVPDRVAEGYRFRHALLAETVYATLLPGEREDLHARLARALRDDATLAANGSVAGKLAEHWAAAGRPADALAASVRAAREVESMSGRAEALRHLERVLDLWPRVPSAESLAGTDLPAVLVRAADLAHLTGNGPRAVEFTRRAIGLLDDTGAERASALHERLGTYLLPTGEQEAGLAAFRRAVELAPAGPAPHRVRVLAALGHALMLATRYEQSRVVCVDAIAAAAAADDHTEVLRAEDVLAMDLCYLGEAARGLALLRAACGEHAVRSAPTDVFRPVVFLSDVLLLTGELREAALVAQRGLSSARTLGLERGVGTVLSANLAEALLGLGDWTRAEAVLAAALRNVASFWSHHIHMLYAALALGRGDLDAAEVSLRLGAQGGRDPASVGQHAALAAELALARRRPDEAATVVDDGRRIGPVTSHGGARAQLCALGLRVEADRVQIAAAGRDPRAVAESRSRADQLLVDAERSAGNGLPDAEAWASVARAEHAGVVGRADPSRWRAAVDAWDRLGRPYRAAQCRRYHAAALLGTGGSTVDAAAAAREAYRVAVELGARPLQQDLERLARIARLNLVPAPAAEEPGLVRRPSR